MLHPERSQHRSPWTSRIDGAINRKVPAASHPHHQAGYGGRLIRFSLDAAHDAPLKRARRRISSDGRAAVL